MIHCAAVTPRTLGLPDSSKYNRQRALGMTNIVETLLGFSGGRRELYH